MSLIEVSIYDISNRKHKMRNISRGSGPGESLLDVGLEVEDYLTEEEKQNILKKVSLKRGDIVHITEYGEYRNNGKLIFDGMNLISLDPEIDDYGAVPPSFHVGDEFYPKHWENSIDHNTIIYINHIKYRQQLLDNFCFIHTYTFFDAPLGRFTIYIPEDVANEFLLKIQQDNPVPLCFEPLTWEGKGADPKYTLYYE